MKKQRKIIFITITIVFFMLTCHFTVPHAGRVPIQETVSTTDYFLGEYKNENVKRYQEWGDFKRVSDDATGPTHLEPQYEIKSQTSVTGDIFGIQTIYTNKTISSFRYPVTYQLVAQNSGTYYIGYRTLYDVEEGFRIKNNTLIGTQKNYYKIKIPLYGHFQLIEK